MLVTDVHSEWNIYIMKFIVGFLQGLFCKYDHERSAEIWVTPGNST